MTGLTSGRLACSTCRVCKAYHDAVLLRRVWDLHASGAANCGMRHVAITTNLIAATTQALVTVRD